MKVVLSVSHDRGQVERLHIDRKMVTAQFDDIFAADKKFLSILELAYRIFLGAF